MNYSISSDWVLKVNTQRTAQISNGRYQPIPAIEPDTQFTKSTIGIYINSPSASPSWYAAGEILQAWIVPFGEAGAAQGESIRAVLNRYMVHRFTVFPFADESRYLLSIVPKQYLRDISVKVWEFQGNDGETPETLAKSIKAVHQRVIAEATATKALINKVLKK